ncbi:CocE/NonD family hydrolase [Chloroflexia bacterium SDU3-3]|nr:CocE/NonD family hydrolase [Chloroflexia bacterium SDU3-3]
MSSQGTGEHEVITSFDVAVPCRDGAVLRANIARPAGEGRWPALLIRTPYSKDQSKPDPLMDMLGLAREGFAVIVQDVRGRFRSDGVDEFTPFTHEAEDGADAVAWAAALPFCTGVVFMVGSSYGGAAGWAAATAQPPALRAFAAHQSPSTPWRTLFYRGGVPEVGAMVPWFLSFGGDTLMRRHRDAPAELQQTLGKLFAEVAALPANLGGPGLAPLAALERAGVGAGLLALYDGQPSPMAQALEAAQAYERITAPALISGGWYDLFCQGAIDQFVGMRARAGSAAAREHTRLIMGPWTHGALSHIIGERSFGLQAAPGLRAEVLRFLREPLGDAAPVRIFVMGANVWRDEREWPLARTQVAPWYLGGGTFGPDQRPSPPALLRYDPNDPAPTWGGGTLGFTELAGPRDLREVERREDVLIYTSDALGEDLEVTGAAIAELWVVSDMADSDFIVRLVDVQPNGAAYAVAEGTLRARHRAAPDMPWLGEPLQAGTPTLLRIALTPTSNVFQRGHRVRIHITCGSAPRWARNTSTWDQRDAAQVARHHVLHDEAHPSRVLLPIIPTAS